MKKEHQNPQKQDIQHPKQNTRKAKVEQKTEIKVNLFNTFKYSKYQ